MDREEFTDRVAVVTGGGGGMGLATALELAARGARVVVLDLKDPPPQLERDPGRCRYRRGDVSDRAFVDDAFSAVGAEHGSLDYLVNAAGVLWFGRDASALDIDPDTWDRVLAINLRGMVNTARAAAPLMRAGAAMVHVSSIQCLRGDDRPQDAYQAAKAGVLALSRSLAIQLAPRAIRSNALLPGPTASPMQERWQRDPEALAATATRVPLGRVGEVADMAAAILFLLSPAASFITGTELVVDGGLTARP